MKINTHSLAQRYAKAYDGLSANAVQSQAMLIAYRAALDALKEADIYIQNPALPFAAKAEIIDKAIAAGPARELVRLLVQAKRFNLRFIILQEVQALLDLRQGLKRVQVASASPLGDEGALTQALSKYFNSKIEASFTQDTSLLAGLIIKQGDLQIDGSALGRIIKLQETLIER